MEQGLAKVKIDDINFQQLMVGVKDRNIRIPDFQREFVWELNQIIRLLDSIYNHYPIGSFLLWRSNDEIESYRTIGDIDLYTSKDGIVHYVLDGQQRITSLFASLENADIKVKNNGKIISKKIEIYFDLDNEIFLADPYEKLKQKEIYKPKRVVSIPNHGDYSLFFDTFAKKLDETNYSTQSIFSWLVEEVYGGRKSYAEMFLNFCVNWGFLEKKDGICIDGGNKDVIFQEDKAGMLKILADYFLWFDDIYYFLSESPAINEHNLKSFVNSVSKEQISDIWYLRQRLHWLTGLGLGEFTNGEFSLTESGLSTLQKTIYERKQLAIRQAEQQAEYEKRFISVKDIVGSSILKLAKQLNEERYEALDKVHTNFQNYPFSIIYVLDQPIDVACEIFERINNSGKVLNLVDLMVAKSYSPSFNLRKKLNNFLTELNKEDYGDIPEITIIQCLAASLGSSIKRSDILLLDKDRISESWEDVTESIRQAVDFLKSNYNLTRSKILPYNVVLVPLSYYFFKNKSSFIPSNAEKQISTWFWSSCLTTKFDSAVETKINDDLLEFDAILKGENCAFEYPALVINEDRIINQKLNLGSAFCKAILALMNQKKPLEFVNSVPVALNAFSKLNAAELHHIFPQAYLKKSQPEMFGLKDSVVNIALAGSGLNKKYKDLAPSVYLEKCDETNSKFNDSLRSHLINNYQDSGLAQDDYQKFLKYRAEIILSEINARVGLISEIEEIFQSNEKEAIDHFEERMRVLIDQVLMEESPHYWKQLDKDILSSVEPRVKKWLKTNPIKTRNDLSPLDFCLIFDYYKIVLSKWILFKNIFGDQKSFLSHITHINNFRNALMHSREIDTPTRKLAEASLVWFDTIFSNR